MSKKCMYCTVYCTIHDISIDVLKNMLLDKIVECKRQYTWSVYTSSYIHGLFPSMTVSMPGMKKSK